MAESVVEHPDETEIHSQTHVGFRTVGVQNFFEVDCGPRNIFERIKVETRLHSVFTTDQDPDIAQERFIASGGYSDVLQVLASIASSKG